MTYELICAGFGGQGMLLIGQLLAYAGMAEGKNVSWLPSYGPEMRGGTANCSVIVSTEEVGSPVVSEPDVAVVMNLPSMQRYEAQVKPGGALLVNSSLIEKRAERTDISVHYIPANELAVQAGNVRVANMVMLGALLKLTGMVSEESCLERLVVGLGQKKAGLIPANREALRLGAASI